MNISSPTRPAIGDGLDDTIRLTGPALRVHRWDERRDGPVTEGALQGKLTSLGYDLLPFVDPHGAIVSARVHPCDRADAVLAGLLKITINGESTILTAGDIVFVPGGATRRVEPVGTSPVLCLEAVCRLGRA